MLHNILVEEDYPESEGEYASGLKNLADFLSKITLPDNDLQRCLNSSNKSENRNQFFVLEYGELFCMADVPFAEQNLELLGEIKHLQPEIEEALESQAPENQPRHAGFFAKVFGRASVQRKQEHDSLRSVYALGLGNWPNILYFDFYEEE